MEPLNIFRNPSAPGETIVLETKACHYNSIHIMDQTGQTVYKEPVLACEQVIIANPISIGGIYFVRTEENGVLTTG